MRPCPSSSARPPARRPASSIARPWQLALVALAATPAQAQEPQGPADAAHAEPSLAELQHAAVEAARLQPERIRSIERRLRTSALLPQVHVRLGRGYGQLQSVTDYNGSSRLTVGDRDAWQWDVSAAWSLDRLLFHPEELRLSREAERMASHRERLLREVAELHGERERLRSVLALTPPASPLGDAEARLRLEELTALLDALTGGRLTRGTEGQNYRRRGFGLSLSAPPQPPPAAPEAPPRRSEDAE